MSYLMHASASLDSVRPLSNDERRANWASKFYLFAHHRKPAKPRIRVTVPEPLTPARSGDETQPSLGASCCQTDAAALAPDPFDTALRELEKTPLRPMTREEYEVMTP